MMYTCTSDIHKTEFCFRLECFSGIPDISRLLSSLRYQFKYFIKAGIACSFIINSLYCLVNVLQPDQLCGIFIFSHSLELKSYLKQGYSAE